MLTVIMFVYLNAVERWRDISTLGLDKSGSIPIRLSIKINYLERPARKLVYPIKDLKLEDIINIAPEKLYNLEVCDLSELNCRNPLVSYKGMIDPDSVNSLECIKENYRGLSFTVNLDRETITPWTFDVNSNEVIRVFIHDPEFIPSEVSKEIERNVNMGKYPVTLNYDTMSVVKYGNNRQFEGVDPILGEGETFLNIESVNCLAPKYWCSYLMVDITVPKIATLQINEDSFSEIDNIYTFYYRYLRSSDLEKARILRHILKGKISFDSSYIYYLPSVIAKIPSRDAEDELNRLVIEAIFVLYQNHVINGDMLQLFKMLKRVKYTNVSTKVSFGLIEYLNGFLNLDELYEQMQNQDIGFNTAVRSLGLYTFKDSNNSAKEFLDKLILHLDTEEDVYIYDLLKEIYEIY